MKAFTIFTLIWISTFASARAGEMDFILLSNDSNSLYRVCLPLGTPELIGEIDGGNDFVELVEADSVRLYAFERASDTLYVLDRFDGSVIRTAPLDQDLFVARRGFDLSPEGILYGVLPGMQLRTIDPLTGETTLVASISGAARIEAIAFSDTGTLFAMGSVADNPTSETLFTLSTSTGVLTRVGQLVSSDIDDLTFGPDGFLYGVDTERGQEAHLVRIDPATAAITDLGSTGVTTVSGIVAIRQPIKLSISVNGGNVQLRWPSSTLGFELQYSQSMIDWEPLAVAPAIIGDWFVVDFATQAGRQFFRLSR